MKMVSKKIAVAIETQGEFLVNFRFSVFAFPHMADSGLRLQENFYKTSSASEENNIFCIFEEGLIFLAVCLMSWGICSVCFMWMASRPEQSIRAGGNRLLFMERSAIKMN